MKEIRAFFKLACQADSKYARKILKNWFFEEILLRKPLKSHATSRFFCSRKLPWCAYDYAWVLKNIVLWISKVVFGTSWPQK